MIPNFPNVWILRSKSCIFEVVVSLLLSSEQFIYLCIRKMNQSCLYDIWYKKNWSIHFEFVKVCIHLPSWTSWWALQMSFKWFVCMKSFVTLAPKSQPAPRGLTAQASTSSGSDHTKSQNAPWIRFTQNEFY